MLLATHRTAPTTSTKCTRLYARGIESITRSTPITTSSQYVQKGDTTCVIQTKTIEQYDASKKL